MQRSLVSDIAGTTRDTVHSMFSYQDQLVEILDTAGLRRATKVKERLEYYASTRTEQAIAESDIVYLVIDITQGLTEQDKKIADKIAESQKACLFVLNKCDLKPQKNKSRQGADLSQEMYKDDIAKVRQDFPVLAYAPMVAVSCYQPHTLEQLLQSTFKLHKQNGRKVDEHELVRALKEWVVARPPARRGNRPPLLRSLRQVGQYPPRFVLKVYGEVDDNYVRYLTNNVRKEFGFARVPLYVEVVHGS
jgi:GTP-binding protein